MRGGQRVGNLDAEFENLLDFHGPAFDAMLQRRTLQILHDDKWAAFVLIDIVDGADVGVIQRRSRPCFTLESFECLPVLGRILRQEF